MRHRHSHPGRAYAALVPEGTGAYPGNGTGAAGDCLTPERADNRPLPVVAAGIRDGVYPLRFMDSINAGSHQVGNRSFLRWVGRLHATPPDSHEHGSTIQELRSQRQDCFPAGQAPLQFGKKRRKKGAPATQGTPELTSDTASGSAEPVASEPGATLPGAGPGNAATTAGRKKKQLSGAHTTEKPVQATIRDELSIREKILFDCCYRGDAGRLKRMLSQGNFDINISNQDGTCLAVAAYFGHAAVVRELLSVANININLVQPRGYTPLYIAVEKEREEIVRLLLADRHINASLGVPDDKTPLHLAVEINHEKIVRLLLAHPGTNVNARKQSNGATPLVAAAQTNLAGMAELLLAHGADVNLGLWPVHSLPLLIATIQNHVEVVRLLLKQQDIRVDETTADGLTALCAASQEGHEEIAGLLLEQGADPNIPTHQGPAPLHVAVVYRHPAILAMLLDAGADILLRLPTGGINLLAHDIALLMGDRESLRILEEHHPDKPARATRFESQAPCLQPQGQVPDDEPVWSTPPTTPPPEWTTPPPTPPSEWTTPASTPPPEWQISPAAPAAPAHHTDEAGKQPANTLPVPALPQGSPVTGANATADSRPGAIESEPPVPGESGNHPGQARSRSTLAVAKDALTAEVLKKLDSHTLDAAEGIRLLVYVRAAANIDMLYTVYNRLAGMERERRRTRRHRSLRHRLLAAEAEPAPAHTTPHRYAVGKRENLDSGAAEAEIRKHLAPACHRFVSQAVNNVEFGRGKYTPGYPGLLHASVGIPGLGSCSVFYHTDAARQQNRIVGIGHHLDPETYQLDYATDELHGCRTLRLS